MERIVSARFAVGDPVVVSDGPLARYRGHIIASAPPIKGEPYWCVRFPGVLRVSTLGESILAPDPRGVPLPSPSDDDVMSPLRNIALPEGT